nr:MAG TPA: Putative platelet activating factor [Caudoviricetes sp.]
MKTRKQIIEWLDAQPWKNEFYEAIVTSNRAGMILYSVNLFDVFDWSLTKQGVVTWMERNKEYLRWYDSTDKPMSWKEYCRQNPAKEDDWFISGACGVLKCNGKRERGTTADINIMSKELCEAFLAYMKLIQLRNAWEKDDKALPRMYKILVIGDSITVYAYANTVEGISFGSIVTAKEFMSTFKDLLEEAKPLL